MSRNPKYDQALWSLDTRVSRDMTLMTDTGFSFAALSEEISKLTARMHCIYESKDTDYSENDLPMGNFRESAEMGIEPWRGILLRIGDKKRRLGSFIKKQKQEVSDEKVDDTLLDLANYALLGLTLFTEFHKEQDNLEPVRDVWLEGKSDQSLALHYMEQIWMDLASEALSCRFIYEFGTEDQWKEETWSNLNQYYLELANFSKNYS